MKLSPGMHVSETDPKNKVSGLKLAKSMDLFPQIIGFGAKETCKRSIYLLIFDRIYLWIAKYLNFLKS